MPTLQYPHIEINESGVPCISGTKTKVVEIVMDHLAWGWEAREIVAQYPYLSHAQVHAALGFYYDNQAEIDQDIVRRDQMVEEIKSRTRNELVQEKLRKLKYPS